ncbi:MAG: prepilin-type N-terminal cleavage/methylation domain-containing protein [Patescibacteria group bacterium]
MKSSKGFTPLEVFSENFLAKKFSETLKDIKIINIFTKYKKIKSKESRFLTGFTLIELLVVVAIISILSSIIMFSVTQYINRGKDASVAGNLAVLVPSGEVYYDNNNSSYDGFCESSVVVNSLSEIASANKHCFASANAWAACGQLFTNNLKAYCVDSRGVKKEIDNSVCANITVCP